ncbi:hypothetical protein BDW71DRAFT_192324 [Aspergillus fruticulosus]
MPTMMNVSLLPLPREALWLQQLIIASHLSISIPLLCQTIGVIGVCAGSPTDRTAMSPHSLDFAWDPERNEGSAVQHPN